MEVSEGYALSNNSALLSNNLSSRRLECTSGFVPITFNRDCFPISEIPSSGF